MKRFHLLVSVAAILVVTVTSVAVAGPPPLAKVLEDVVKDNFSKSQAENLKGALATIHSESPAFDGSEDTLRVLFKKYDLRYELLSFKLLGSDGDYAVARVSQKTDKANGADYSNNIIDSMYVFRRERGSWKLWQQVMLETRIIE